MSARGFTLVELAIVLGVVSVVAAYVVPDFIEMARNDLAQASARQMLQIQDASRSFLHDHAEIVGDAERSRWPGEALPTTGPAVCNQAPGGPRAELLGERYLSAADLVNPWERNYDMSLERGPSAGAGHADCKLIVATSVPAGVAGVIKTYMPDAHCELFDGGNLCPGSPGGGFDRCCARAVRPGYQASLLALTPLACDQLKGASWDTGLSGSNQGECNAHAKVLDTEGGYCYWANEGDTCGDQYLIMGGRIVSCGKECEETQAYCCKADL